MAIVKKISELTPKGSNLANTDLLIVGVDNGTDYDLKSVTGAQVLGNVANGLVPYTGATTNVNLGEFEVKAGQVSLDTNPTGTATVTTTRWNDSLGISETTLKGGEVVLKNGVDLVARVVNKVTPNTTLTKANYQVVRISGAQGQRLAVNLAQANNDNNSADTLGIVCETIATNAEGFIMTMGQLENVNTTGSLQSETWVDGDVLYLSPTTAGKITNIKPSGATGHIVILGYVEYAHAVNGKIYVKVMNGWELDELHNVSISNPLDKQLLSYENSTSLWKNKSVTTADISDSTNKRYVTDANLTVIGNTSGTNTGDQDLSNLAPKSNPTFTGLTTLDTLKVTTGNYITPVDVVGIDVTGNVNRISASNGRTALGLGTLATQSGTFSGTSSGTNTGDQVISDETINLTDITTNNVSSTKHGFAPKTPNNTNTFLRGDGTWATPSAGGLTYFTEAQNTTSPNATVPVDSLTAVTGTTNGDFAIIPKGTGAILAQIPDDTINGGVKRGANAIDLQTVRTVATNVASGQYSLTLGYNNKASNTGSIAIGNTSYATGLNSIALGKSAFSTGISSCAIGGDTGTITASGDGSVAIGGAGTTASSSGAVAMGSGSASNANAFAVGYSSASGTNSVSLGGQSGGANGSTATGNGSFSMGLGCIADARNSTVFGVYTSSKGVAQRLSVGTFSSIAPYVKGSAQLSMSSTTTTTTTNTAIELTSYEGTAINLVLQNNEAIRVKGSIIGKQTASTNVACYDFDCVIVRGTTAGSTILPLSNVNLVLDTITLGTIPTLTVNTTLGGLSVKSGAKTTTTIKWSCRIDSTEVILA